MNYSEYCDLCTNKGFNPKKGMVCALTDEKPHFIGTCPDFLKDEVIAEKEIKKAQRASSTENISSIESKVYALESSFYTLKMILLILGGLWLIFIIYGMVQINNAVDNAQQIEEKLRKDIEESTKNVMKEYQEKMNEMRPNRYGY